jgi:hypothetical protein
MYWKSWFTANSHGYGYGLSPVVCRNPQESPSLTRREAACVLKGWLRVSVAIKLCLCDFLSSSTYDLGLRPTPYDLRPTTHDLRPTTYDLRPTTYDLRPTTYDLRPTTCDLRPTTYDLRPTYIRLRRNSIFNYTKPGFGVATIKKQIPSHSKPGYLI